MVRRSYISLIVVLFFCSLLAILVSACQTAECNNSPNCNINQSSGNQPEGNSKGNLTGSPSPEQSTPVLSPTQMPTLIPTVVPTPILSNSPTPLPYTVSKTGDVCKPPYNLFQATGWIAEQNSLVFTGNGSNVVVAPCNISTPNYSVVATINLFKNQLAVGVIAHTDGAGQSGYVGGAGCRNISFGKCGFFINDSFGDIMNVDQENENLSGQTHTYKLVVNGVNLKLFYDNSLIPIVSKSLATFPQAGYAGFECFEQCQVTGFTVTGL